MNVLDRINSQTVKPAPIPEIQHAQPEIVKAVIIPPEDLRKILMDEIVEKIPEIAETPPNIRIFNGLEDFVAWYFNEREKFSQGQQVALSTLIQGRNAIYQGCKCKEKDRRIQFNGYFKTFWENNKTTDLPPKVLEVGNFQEISFRIDDVEFVKFSSATPEKV